MTISSDFSINAVGDIRHVSGSDVYSVLELHAWLQDLADNDSNTGDDLVSIESPNPSKLDGPRDINVSSRLNLLSSGSVVFNIDDTTAQYFNFGSIKQKSFAEQYSGLKTIGSIVAASPMYVVQNGNKLTVFWPNGHIQILVKIKSAGSLIDSGNVSVYSRKWGQTYSHFDTNLSAGGESPAALSTAVDDNILLSYANAGALSSKISVSVGDTTQDLGNGNGPKLYKGTITLTNLATLSEMYQYLQYLANESSVATIGSVPGWRYRKLDASYSEIQTAPFGTFAGGSFFAAQGWWVTGVQSYEGLKYQLIAHDGTTQYPPVPPTTRGVLFTNLVVGSQVVIFDTGTQTIIDSTNSSGISFSWSEVAVGGRTLDYTVMKVGYKPIRVTGVTVNGSVQGIPIQQVEDRAYSASSGLTYGTTATVDTSTKIFGLTVASTVQNWYNFWIESWISQSTLRNKEFPITTNGPNSFSLMSDYEFNSASDIDYLSRDGMRYVNSSNEVTAIWAGVLSLGEATGFTAEYQQVLGATPTKANKTGPVDQLIQIFGDSTHGDFDYRNYLTIKMQPSQYEPAEVNVVALYGALEDQFYIISMQPILIPDMPSGDPGITTITVTNHGASPVTWDAGNGDKQYSITILDSGNNDREQIHTYINYALSGDATFGGTDPFNWPELIKDIGGTTYETMRGTILGSAGALLKGCRVIRTGSIPHPEFSRFQSDDGTYGIVPTTTGLTLNGLVAGSTVYIFEAGTQTVIASTTNSGTSFSWSEIYVSDRDVDYTVIKLGFEPIRVTNVGVVSSIVTQNISQALDREGVVSTGLTYGSDFTVNRGTKRLTLSAVTPWDNFYSALMEAFRDQAALRNTSFPISPDGTQTFTLKDGWEFTSGISNLRRGGHRYLNSSGVETAVWAGFLSLGSPTVSGRAIKYQTSPGSGTTSYGVGPVDSLIQTYGDLTHGNFDYRTHIVFKVLEDGYQDTYFDHDDSGFTSLVDNLYAFPLISEVSGVASGNPGSLPLAITDHGNSPVSWDAGNGSKDYSITIVDSGTTSATDILRWIIWNKAQGGTFQGKDAFNWPRLIQKNGDNFETVKGIVWGGVGAEIKGVRVLRGSSAHPGFSRFQADDGSYGMSPATTGLTITGLISGSTVYIFETGTQTIIDSTTNSGTSFTWSEVYSADRGVDYTVIKAGYTPIRVVNSVVSSSVKSVSVQYSEEREYEASTGLTFGVDFSANPSTNRVSVSKLTTTKNLYSALIEAWRDESSLRNVQFPIVSDGFSTYSFVEWDFDNSTSISYLSKGGFRYLISGVEKAVFCAIQTSTLPANTKIWKLQVDGGSWSLLKQGTVFDGIVQTYGDVTHGNFDYREFFAIKATNDGYTVGEVDLINDLGNTQIVDNFYFAPLTIVETGVTAGNPGALDIVVNNISNGTSWNGITVGQEVVVANGISGSDVLRYLTWQRHQGNLLSFGQLVLTQGSSFKSVRGKVYDGTPLEIEGCRVVLKSDGTSVHPDFVIFEGNGTGTYEPPVLATASVQNIIAGSRLFIKNLTTNTIMHNAINAGTSYTFQYLNGTGYTGGDSVEVRIMYVDGISCKAEFTANSTAANSGWTIVANQVDCPVYNSYAIDGSLVTEFAADYPNVQIDLNDADNVWSAKRFYAWYKYTLFTEDGIDQWWGSVTAIDAGNLRINSDVLDLFFDNVKAQSATPSDNIRVFRSDGLYPQATPTSGGGGIGFYATGTVYIAETGVSGLTTQESENLTKILSLSKLIPAAL